MYRKNVKRDGHQFLTYPVILTGNLQSYFIITHSIKHIWIRFMNGEVSINRIMLYPMLRVSEISGVHSYYFSKVVFRINDLIKKIILKVH